MQYITHENKQCEPHDYGNRVKVENYKSPEDALQAAKQSCNFEGDACSGVVQFGSGDVALCKSLAVLKIPVLKIIGLNLQVTTTYVKASYEKVRATKLNITDTKILCEG